eukprot:1139547-Pelagomonas_calceolata.AAC.12
MIAPNIVYVHRQLFSGAYAGAYAAHLSGSIFRVQVHACNKSVDPTINWYEVARAMAGFTGADCMGLMQRGARMAARQVSAHAAAAAVACVLTGHTEWNVRYNICVAGTRCHHRGGHVCCHGKQGTGSVQRAHGHA